MPDNGQNEYGKNALMKEEDVDSFFTNNEGEMAYCEQCMKCRKKCKQSFRITNLICHKFAARPEE